MFLVITLVKIQRFPKMALFRLYKMKGKWVVKSKNAVEESNTSWFDFTVATNDATKFYVNVKISELRNSADNTNCMGGIYYVLTGSVPPNSMIRIDKKLKREVFVKIIMIIIF